MNKKNDWPAQVDRVLFKVRLEQNHPSFWAAEWGMLAVYLTPISGRESKDRAKAIVAALPFEVVDDCAVERLCYAGEGEPIFSREMIYGLGFAYALVKVPLEQFGEAGPEQLPFGKEDGPFSCQEGP